MRWGKYTTIYTLAWGSSRGQGPRELMREKNYIQLWIPNWVIIWTINNFLAITWWSFNHCIVSSTLELYTVFNINILAVKTICYIKQSWWWTSLVFSYFIWSQILGKINVGNNTNGHESFMFVSLFSSLREDIPRPYLSSSNLSKNFDESCFHIFIHT